VWPLAMLAAPIMDHNVRFTLFSVYSFGTFSQRIGKIEIQNDIYNHETETESETTFNPFLFIRGLSCPISVQTSLTQNCLKLTILGFPYNYLPVSCGDIGF
jgi:hypothetical protein